MMHLFVFYPIDLSLLSFIESLVNHLDMVIVYSCCLRLLWSVCSVSGFEHSAQLQGVFIE